MDLNGMQGFISFKNLLPDIWIAWKFAFPNPRQVFLRYAIDTSLQMFPPHDICFFKVQDCILSHSGKFTGVKPQTSQGTGSDGRIYKVTNVWFPLNQKQ